MRVENDRIYVTPPQTTYLHTNKAQHRRHILFVFSLTFTYLVLLTILLSTIVPFLPQRREVKAECLAPPTNTY